MIIVLDRATPEAEEGAAEAYTDFEFPVKFVIIQGPPGWICPAAAWNAAYQAASGNTLFCTSSEVVQDAHNVQKAQEICKNDDTIVFGACHNSEKTNLVTGAEPGLLVSSKMPRPLGFIACVPAKNMYEVGGNDLEFMKGLWYEDDDLYLRLWRTGLNFQFNDNIHGTHLDHPRPDLDTPAGQAKIATNQAYMIKKHGLAHPWPSLIRLEQRQEGKLTWMHV